MTQNHLTEAELQELIDAKLWRNVRFDRRVYVSADVRREIRERYAFTDATLRTLTADYAAHGLNRNSIHNVLRGL